ncbi:HAD family hydrolase [Rhodovulum adriaticum]|uniref:Hydroxymethylpyrimidine pyrophosphatase-like HAD family hydrolase n=1 Tax=Rhodovulum adriaticum TaxID=35804 RepID=A0A4R2NNL7_RHOAD|nr:HAD family hydrolase [Rhodovulum adriaticum]MBK1634529.1 alpha,alpha-trehalose-phosphate synthase [Rhodovulum adriaticum]TCP23101.1 hydroxymethylpyrimidine pyrophosphatase-like HAD family hydrolase [Rhodovulum adriaticum]
MTIAQTLTPPLSARRFVLATDLDGTFLGGSESDRRTLYDWIEANRVSVGLIFVTGRDPAFIMEMCAERGLPWPDYVVGDVGTTIAEVVPRRAINPIPALEADIANRWGDKGAEVRETLDGHPGLTLQPTAFRHRVSFDLDPAAYCPSAEDKIAGLGLDWLISDNRFFDVLPKGVSKGPSLRRLVEHLGIPEHRVLAAGDTLNDLSMLECGLNAVAVGNSEPALLDRVRELDHLHTARAHGAGGILEAIAAFALHDTPQGA